MIFNWSYCVWTLVCVYTWKSKREVCVNHLRNNWLTYNITMRHTRVPMIWSWPGWQQCALFLFLSIWLNLSDLICEQLNSKKKFDFKCCVKFSLSISFLIALKMWLLFIKMFSSVDIFVAKSWIANILFDLMVGVTFF